MDDSSGSNIGFQNLKQDDDLYKYVMKFIDENYNLKGLKYDFFDYRIYILRNLLPFLTNIKKFLLIQSDNQGKSSKNQNFSHLHSQFFQDEVNESNGKDDKNSCLLDDFAYSFIRFWENVLTVQERKSFWNTYFVEI